jgi:limonene-1,2-epoxide hydrolase
VLEFIRAFPRMNADELIEYFTEDALYHNIPLPPLRGRTEIYESFKGLPMRFKGVEVEILNQVASGNLVMNERIDYFLVEDRRIALPIAGVFELHGGKIRSWREYFDLATFRSG